MDRRTFLKKGLAAAAAGSAPGEAQDAWAGKKGETRETSTVLSVCLGCNARCGNRVTIEEGKVVAVSGNPYHPYNTLGAPIPWGTPLDKALKARATVCGKAHEMWSYATSPYRIVRPLKRSGPRGSCRFEPIEWDQLIKEIAEGGRLFAHIGEDRVVPGLKELDSDAPLDPSAPELGPKRNGLVFMTGRLQSGRKEFIDRFVKYAFGSVNRIGHTDICGIGFRMGNYAFTEGKAVELKADPWDAEYILVFGANVYEALQPGLNTYGAALAHRRSKGEVKFVIIDPRAQKASAHAHRWIPIRPGQDGAFAMGMIRWMIENGRYNRRFLEAPNEKAALALGNGGYVNAAHLVVWDEKSPLHGRFLRASLLPGGKDNDAFVVLGPDGAPAPHSGVERAILDVDRRLRLADGAVRVRSCFNLLKEAAFQYTLEEYAGAAGVEPGLISEVAHEFSAHAPKAAVCQYHGAGNYVNGVPAAYAVAVLNALVGSLQRRGGYLTSGGGAASWKRGVFDLIDFKGKRKPRGVKISREKAAYQETSEFQSAVKAGKNPYPAKRPWFPFTKGGLSVEALAGMDQGYPYKASALFLYFYNPVYSTPGGQRFASTLQDTDKVPLLVSIDIGINESNIYADYIVPDVTYAEGHYGWLSPHAPAMRFTALRTPCTAPLVSATSDGRPICLETFLIDLAKELELPGFGQQAIPAKEGAADLEIAEDFYLRGFANIAVNGDVEADDGAAAFVEKNYPAAGFKEILPGRLWKRVCTLLARGGLFVPREKLFKGDAFISKVKRFTLFNEELASTVCSITGRRFSGVPHYAPPLEGDGEYPLILVSHKTALHTQSRTVWHPVAMALHPENHVVMNPEDARRLHLEDGAQVKVSSASNPRGVQGVLRISEGIRPGVVAISISYGHTQLGAGSLRVSQARRVFLGGEAIAEGDVVSPDPFLGGGMNPNLLGDLDPRFGKTPLVDLTAGIPDFSSTRVRVEKVRS